MQTSYLFFLIQSSHTLHHCCSTQSIYYKPEVRFLDSVILVKVEVAGGEPDLVTYVVESLAMMLLCVELSGLENESPNKRPGVLAPADQLLGRKCVGFGFLVVDYWGWNP